MKLKFLEFFTNKILIPWSVFLSDLATNNHWIAFALVTIIPIVAVIGIISKIKDLRK